MPDENNVPPQTNKLPDPKVQFQGTDEAAKSTEKCPGVTGSETTTKEPVKSDTPEVPRVESENAIKAREIAKRKMEELVVESFQTAFTEGHFKNNPYRDVPNSLGVALNKVTGEFFTAVSGELIYKMINEGGYLFDGKGGLVKTLMDGGFTINKKTDEMFKVGDTESASWNRLNCSEAYLADQIFEARLKIEDFVFVSVEFDEINLEVIDKHTCANCDENMKEAIDRKDVISNTKQAKTQRNNVNRYPRDPISVARRYLAISQKAAQKSYEEQKKELSRLDEQRKKEEKRQAELLATDAQNLKSGRDELNGIDSTIRKAEEYRNRAKEAMEKASKEINEIKKRNDA